MAIITSYPHAVPTTNDLILISKSSNKTTRSTTVGDVIDLIETGLLPGVGTVTSIGVTAPSAFAVTNSPVTSTGTIAITGSGTTSQYIDGTGALQSSPNQALDTTSDVVFESVSGEFILKDVTNNNNYKLEVTAGVLGIQRIFPPDATVPNAPTIGTAVAGSAQATVSFTAPLDDGGLTITSYTATSSPEGLTGTVSQAGSGSITVTGLTNGTSYTFTVTATNAIGTSVASAASNSAGVTVPDAPTIGTAVAGVSQATVPFTAPASDGGLAITSYTATSIPGGVTGIVNQSGSGTITVTGLTNNTAYTFTVAATNDVGTSASSSASNSVTPALTWYASQLGAGTKDGTSEANAADISSVESLSIGVRDTLYLMDTITDIINWNSSITDIDLRGDLTGRELIHDTQTQTIITGFRWGNAGNSKMYGGTYTNGREECIRLTGSYNIEAFDVITTNASVNQNLTCDGTGTSVWNNLTSTGAPDDGVTGHDSATITIQGQGTNISGNSEGVAMAGTSTAIIRNCTITGNSSTDVTFGVDAEDCTFGTIEGRGGSTVKLNRVNVTTLIKDVGPSTGQGAIFNITNSVVQAFLFRSNAPTPATGSRGTIQQTLIKDDINVRGAFSFLKCRFLGEVDVTDGEQTFKHNFFSNEISINHSFAPTNTIVNVYYNIFKAIPNNKHVVLVDTGTTWNSNNNTYLTETLVSQRGLGSYLNITESNSIISNLDRGFWSYSGTPISNTNLFNNAPTSGVTLNNSVSGDPLLVDVANDDFSLGALSPAIGAGLTLTENEGINTANWGNGVDESPIVTTKLQGTSWDIGAYVS